MLEILSNGKLKPNHDSMNHILIIICGKGNHGEGYPVLFDFILPLLDELEVEYHSVAATGLFLVRLNLEEGFEIE